MARLDEVRLDARALVWSLALSLLMGIAVGLAPALLWRRQLRGFGGAGGRVAGGGTAARTIRRALLVAEVALAIVLLVGAGLLVRSWWQVESVDPGFRPERVLAMQVGAPALMAPAQRADFYRRALDRIESLPRVERAGFISDAFIGGSPERTLTTELEGEAVSARLQYRSDEVSEGLFQAFGTRLRSGRFFSLRDGPASPRVAIVNDALARRLWPGEDAVGRRLKRGPADSASPWLTVVGIVDDMRRQGLETEPVPQIFEPVAQNPSGAGFLPRPHRGRESGRPGVGGAGGGAAVGHTSSPLRRVDPGNPAARVLRAAQPPDVDRGRIRGGRAPHGRDRDLRPHAVRGLDAHEGDCDSHGGRRRQGRYLSGWSSARGLALSAAGVALGLLGGAWVGRAARNLLFEVGPLDPVTFIGGSALLLAVALAACGVPARRAMKVAPIVALRED